MTKTTYEGLKETAWWDPFWRIRDRIKKYRLKKRAIQETRHSHNNPGEVKYGETHRPADVNPVERERAMAESNDKRTLIEKFMELKADKRYQQKMQEREKAEQERQKQRLVEEEKIRRFKAEEQERLRLQERERIRLAEQRRLRRR